MLLPGCAYLRSATFGDVYLDDLVILALAHVSRSHLKDDFLLLPNAMTHCMNHWVVVSAKKCGSAFEHEVWGGR